MQGYYHANNSLPIKGLFNMHAPAEKTKQPYHLDHPAQFQGARQTAIADNRAKMAQLQANQAMMEVSPQQQHLQALQMRMAQASQLKVQPDTAQPSRNLQKNPGDTIQCKHFEYVNNGINSNTSSSEKNSMNSVAQLEKEFIAGDGEKVGEIIEVDDKEDRKGWDFWQLGDDFVWVKVSDGESFKTEYKKAVKLTSFNDDEDEERIDNAVAEVHHGEDDYEVGQVISIDMIKESRSDHKYVIVMVKGGPNIKIHYGTNGGLYEESNEISNQHGVPVHSYKPPATLTGKSVSQIFHTTKDGIEKKFTGGNCGALAGDLIEQLGGEIQGGDYDFLK